MLLEGRHGQSYWEVMKFLLKLVPLNPEGRGDLGVNIKMDIKETGCEAVD
jgi:hypothetical protein